MTQTITKRDLTDALHEAHDGALTRAQIAGVVECLGALTAQLLQRGDTVILPGLGRLSTTASAERTGRNPRTGEPVTIPAGRRVKFKPAAKLKEAL